MDGSGYRHSWERKRKPSMVTLLVAAAIIVTVGYVVAIKLREATSFEACRLFLFKHCEPLAGTPRKPG